MNLRLWPNLVIGLFMPGMAPKHMHVGAHIPLCQDGLRPSDSLSIYITRYNLWLGLRLLVSLCMPGMAPAQMHSGAQSPVR